MRLKRGRPRPSDRLNPIFPPEASINYKAQVGERREGKRFESAPLHSGARFVYEERSRD